MASISGNFNFPSDKGIPSRPRAAAPQAETAPDDLVTLSGSNTVAPRGEDTVSRATSGEPTQAREKAAPAPSGSSPSSVRRAPATLMMDDVQGIAGINLSQSSNEGHGLTGLNTLSSVVASGRFEGLNGSYGPGHGLAGLK